MTKTEAAPGRKPTRKAAREAFSATFRELRRAHPDAHCELDHKTPFELVVATVLSAQSTDVAVNKVTPELFRRFPTPQALALAEPSTVEGLLGKLGMFRQKTKSLIGLSKKLMADHAGSVPETLAELITLPGVGRKTANVVLGVAFNKPEGVVVDTHVQRISQRLGWTDHATPDKIESDLMALAPRRHWDILSHTLIFHGRRVCTALRPACVSCAVNKRCPSAFEAEAIGRKPPRLRAVATPSPKPGPKPTSKPKKPPKELVKRPGRAAEPGLKLAKHSARRPERTPR